MKAWSSRTPSRARVHPSGRSRRGEPHRYPRGGYEIVAAILSRRSAFEIPRKRDVKVITSITATNDCVRAYEATQRAALCGAGVGISISSRQGGTMTCVGAWRVAFVEPHVRVVVPWAAASPRR